MRTFPLAILLPLFFAACADDSKELIPPLKMAEILADVHLAEASIQGYTLAERDSVAVVYYQHIFRIHGVGEEAFYHTMQTYSRRPEVWAGIYEKVVENLTKNSVEGKGEKAPRKRPPAKKAD